MLLPVSAQSPDTALHALLDAAPKQILTSVNFTVHPPANGWELGMVSSIAVDRDGTIYLLHRGDKADPVEVLNPTGGICDLGAKALQNPDSIRIDPQGTSGRSTRRVPPC